MESFARRELYFEKDTPVIRLNFGKVPSVRWVLWPIYAWRIVAPVPKDRKLNVFQRAVLGLARAGIMRIGDITDRLLIAPDLAGLVIVELEQMSLLDISGKPTQRGMSWLEEEEHVSLHELRVGHVFTEAFTGKLWNRFLEGDLPIADTEDDDEGWPILLSGSAGDPWKDRTFSLIPSAHDRVLVACPDVKDVLRVARSHRRQRQRNIEDFIDDTLDAPQLKQVSFIDENPQPFFVALCVRRHDSGDWVVNDPFGYGESVVLRNRLEERLDSIKGLRSWLAPLIGSEPVAPTLEHLQVEAAWMVEERLTLTIRNYESVKNKLIAMQRALLEAESPNAPDDKWNDVLVKADIAVMCALKELHVHYASTHPPYYEDFDRIPVKSRNPIDEAARAIGLESDLPPRILSINRNQMKDAEKGKGTLRSVIVLSLFAARWNDDHPLRSALKECPNLMQRLDELASVRNPAAHGGHTTQSIVYQHIETVYDTVKFLLLLQ